MYHFFATIAKTNLESVFFGSSKFLLKIYNPGISAMWSKTLTIKLKARCNIQQEVKCKKNNFDSNNGINDLRVPIHI